MGNVEPGSFVEKLASSSKPDARASDLSPLEPLLRQIGALSEAVGKDGKPAMAHHFSEQIDPVTNKKLIETRGPSGDALEHVKIVQDRLVEYKLRLESPTLTEAEKQSIREQARSEVQSAVDKALRASNETDFNSAYEIRDELVKKFYGHYDRAKILGDKADASFAEQTPRYREHFADRPRVLETIK